MIEHAAKITAINPSAARFTLEEMFGLVLVGVSILGNIFSARNLHSSLFNFCVPNVFPSMNRIQGACVAAGR